MNQQQNHSADSYNPYNALSDRMASGLGLYDLNQEQYNRARSPGRELDNYYSSSQQQQDVVRQQQQQQSNNYYNDYAAYPPGDQYADYQQQPPMNYYNGYPEEPGYGYTGGRVPGFSPPQQQQQQQPQQQVSEFDGKNMCVSLFHDIFSLSFFCEIEIYFIFHYCSNSKNSVPVHYLDLYGKRARALNIVNLYLEILPGGQWMPEDVRENLLLS